MAAEECNERGISNIVLAASQAARTYLLKSAFDLLQLAYVFIPDFHKYGHVALLDNA
jgi:hypothetical protein